MKSDQDTTEINRATYAAFAEAWKRRDVDALMQLVTDDAVYAAGPRVGQQLLRAEGGGGHLRRARARSQGVSGEVVGPDVDGRVGGGQLALRDQPHALDQGAAHESVLLIEPEGQRLAVQGLRVALVVLVEEPYLLGEAMADGRTEWAVTGPAAEGPRAARGGSWWGSTRQLPYSTLGSQRPMPGNMYSRKIARTWIAMNGIIPAKIWFRVTCGGLTPFR